MINEVYNNNIFKLEFPYTFEFTVNEKKNILAENTKVRFVTTPGIIIEENLISVGTYTSPEWVIGNMQNESFGGRFNAIITDDSISTFTITAIVSTTTNESIIQNNIGKWTWNGIPNNQLDSLRREKIFNIPLDDLGGTQNPTEQDVIDWANTNLEQTDLKNGTVITYNSDPFTMSVAYINGTINIDAGSTNQKITEIYINGVKFTQEFLIDSSANFNESTFKTFLESSCDSLGFTATFLITDNIDEVSSEIQIASTINTGIYNLVIRSIHDTEYDYSFPTDPFYIATTPSGKYKSPNFIWTLNENFSGYEPILFHKSKDNGLISYVSSSGNDLTAEIGNPDKPYKTINRAILETDNLGRIIVDVHNNFREFYGFDINFGFSNKIIMNCSIYGIADGLQLQGYKAYTMSALREYKQIIITGFIAVENTPILLEGFNLFSGKGVFIKDLALVSYNDIPEISLGLQPTVKKILVQNVTSNYLGVNTQITEQGQAILRHHIYEI